MDIRISALHYYPIKSCAGTSSTSVTLEDMGFTYDRRWMVVHAGDGMFVSQRDFPQMALIRPSMLADAMTVTADGLPELRVELRGETTFEEQLANRRLATVWKFHGAAYDEGDVAADWFSSALGVPCRLLHAGPAWFRVAGERQRDGANLPKVGFADGYAVLLASEASLEDLNTRLDTPVPMDRFRPNMIISGENLAPWAEDEWSAVQLPNSGRTLRIAKPCARCVMTSIDQATGKSAGAEPLKTLSKFRRADDGKVMFGSNLTYDSYQPNVAIAIGDPVIPVARR